MCKENERNTDDFVHHVNCVYMRAGNFKIWKDFVPPQTSELILWVFFDSTFDCGDFDMTVTTYSQPMLILKRTGKHHTIIGP